MEVPTRADQIREILSRIGDLFLMYNEAMRDGNDLLLKAAAARLEAEKARDDFKGMKAEARERAGTSLHPTAGQANTDVRFAAMTEAQNALGDNRWFISQHPGYAAEATAHFARATALMSAIQYQVMKLDALKALL